MINKHAGLAPVPLEKAKARALAFGREQGDRLMPASSFAEAIWPGHKMTAQGAGAAASRVLKALERDGRAGWSSAGRRSWGWWAR